MRTDPQVVSSAGVVPNLVVTPTLIFTLFDVVTSLIELLLPEHPTMKAEPLDLRGRFCEVHHYGVLGSSHWRRARGSPEGFCS